MEIEAPATEPARRAGLSRIIGRRRLPVWLQIVTGIVAACAAIAIRLALPLRPAQLPTLTVITAIAFLTPFVGFWAGAAAAVVGGALAFYLLFNPYSWSLANGAAVPLLGYIVLAIVILTTSALYARSERHRQKLEIDALEGEAERSRLFARELAHRLGNTLTIVQSVALQTLGSQAPAAQTFAGRLKALGDANKLLTEHVDTPTARVRDIIETAVRPFLDRPERIAVHSCDGVLPSQSVMTLALAIHELATNAIKHGALSVPTGAVEVHCREEGDHTEVLWIERGGPAIGAPSEQGFGLKLLRRLGGSLEPHDEGGLKCRLLLKR